MNGKLLLNGVFAVLLVGMIAGCKKDDTTTNPGPPAGLTSFSFTAANQIFAVPATGGPASARLTGGTLPYTVEGNSQPAVASATFSHDTLTVTPLAVGSTVLTIADSLAAGQDRVVTLTVNVTGAGSGGLGSGTVTAASTVGTLSLTGTGVWPAGAGPSVVAVFDTVHRVLVMIGYQQVSGSHYNYVLMEIGGLTVGTYLANHTATYQAGYNADTSAAGVTYNAVNDSASVVISSVNGSNLVGTYSGRAQLGANPSISLGGTFNIVYVRGVSPIIITGATAPFKVNGMSQTPDKRRSRP